MNRRRFLRFLGLGSFAAWFVQMPAAVASTLESCHQALSDIRDVALGPGKPKDRLDAIVAIVDGELGSVAPTIQGDFAGVIPAGGTWKVGGDLNLTGDLIVEGYLGSTVDTFTVQGNGFQVLVQNGGRLDWAGKLKTAWANAGDPVTGWETGDLLVVAPTAVGDYTPKETTWQGDWASTFIPSADVTLVDGTVARPEVANVSQTARVHNVSRIMFHSGAGVQSLSSVAVVDSGIESLLDFYPIHFHNAEDSVRGSILADVVVVGGKNHAFVPHSSHGISLIRCAAVQTVDQAFWWNDGDFTHDSVWDRCVVLGNASTPQGAGHRNTGFKFGRGDGNQAFGCVAAGVLGTQHSGGFLWPEADSDDFPASGLVAHNNRGSGVVHYTVQGDLTDLRSYRNGEEGLDQLAYVNKARYSNLVLSENEGTAIGSKGIARVGEPSVFENVVTDGGLSIGNSQATPGQFSEMRAAVLPDGVLVGDPDALWQFTDCGLEPVDFTFIYTQREGSVMSVVEAGVEVHRYEANAWSF